jgi:carbamoylphosphate synthase large subunit
MTDPGGPSAFVTGVGGPAGRAAAAFLREHGVATTVADVRPLAEEPGLVRLPLATEPGFLPALQRELEARETRLLVPTVTEELALVAREREALRATGCAVFISPAEAAEIASDKWLTVQALERAGVGVPRSLAGRERALVIDALGFPLLSKPRRGRGGRGVQIHESLDDFPTASLERIYQEFLPGEEYDVNLFAEPGGRPVAVVVLRKTALRDGRVGNAAGVERAHDADVAALAVAASRALQLEGPIDIDVRRARDGRPLVLEVNARIGANVRSADEVLEVMLERWKNAS